MATTVEKIEVYDVRQSNLKVGERIATPENPIPVDENFNIPISITTGVYELQCYAIAWLSSGFYSKASSSVKMIINAMSKYPELANFESERISADSYDAIFNYNISASFDVANDFNFIISTKVNTGSWSNQTQLPNKTDNDFSYTKTIDTTNQDFYFIKALMRDKNNLNGKSSPVKTLVKAGIEIGYDDEGETISLGHTVEGTTYALQI